MTSAHLPRRAVLGLWLGGLVALGGCAATPTVQQTAPISADLSQYKMVQVSVGAPVTILQSRGYDATAQALVDELSENLRTQGRAILPDRDPAPPRALRVRLWITAFRYVHGATRGSGVGGRAVLEITMTLEDPGTGKTLGTINASHRSSRLEGILSPTTGRQVTAIAKELADRIAGS